MSVRDKLVGGDTSGPPAGRQLWVVTVGNFVDQLELTKPSGILHRRDVDSNLRQLQKQIWFGLWFGIKSCSWLNGENSGFPCRDQREQQQPSREKSAHSAGVSPAKLRSAGSGVNAGLLLRLNWLGSRGLTSEHG